MYSSLLKKHVIIPIMKIAAKLSTTVWSKLYLIWLFET